MMPNKLCPMGFGNTLFTRTDYICLGTVCSWFNDETGKCAVAELAFKSEAKPEVKKTTKAKKPTEG